MPLARSSWERRNFPCRRCARWSRPATTSPPSTRSRRGRPAGAGWSRRRRRCSARPSGWHRRCARRLSLKGEAEQQAFRELARRCRGRRRLWPAAAAGHSRRHAARLPSTAMPRCCRAGAAPRPSSAPSWPATRDRHDDHAMDEGLDTGPVALAERVAIGPDDDRRRTARPPDAVGADADGRGAGARWRPARLTLTPQAERRRDLCQRRSTRRRRASTGAGPAREVHNHIRGLSPFPGAWCEVEIGGKPERLKAAALDAGDGCGRARRRFSTIG